MGDGILLGFSRDSSEHVVWEIKGDSIVRARSFQRNPANTSKTFSADAFEAIAIRPQDHFHRAAWGTTGQKERPQRLGSVRPTGEGVRARAKKGKGLRITIRDLKEFGHIVLGCKRCGHMQETRPEKDARWPALMLTTDVSLKNFVRLLKAEEECKEPSNAKLR